MSGIVGIHFLDGRPVGRAQLASMLRTIAHRGPDGRGVWQLGEVGLGQCLLWTTPESLREALPLVNQSGACVLTADARLDNRRDLIALLGRPDYADVPDSVLILAAYERWGDLCLEYLLGDFAFAIWDARRQVVFCGRDHFGVKPFYYCHRPGRVFAFASEIKALLSLTQDVPRQLNEERVADYLVPVAEDKTSTFYQAIYRLPPGHSLTVDRETLRLRPYWALDPTSRMHLSSDNEYAEAFRDLFTEAVRCRLRTPFSIASLLSGGLDSAAVTSVARDVLATDGPARLHAVSAVFDDVPECDERPFIEAVVAQGGLEPHYVRADRLSPLGDRRRVFHHQDEPYLAPNLFLHWELCRAAQQSGARIVLDGHDGNLVVSDGTAYLGELAWNGDWQRLGDEVSAFSSLRRTSPLRCLQYFAGPAISETLRTGHWRARARAAGGICRYSHVPPWGLAWGGLKAVAPLRIRRAWRTLHHRSNTIIQPAFAHRTRLEDRLHTLQADRARQPRTEQEDHYRNLTWGAVPYFLEVMEKCDGAFGLESRHPFFDKRIAEFCLALPPEQKFHHGLTRMVTRRALNGVLAPQVQWRGDKSNLTPNFTRALLLFERPLLDEVIPRKLEALSDYVRLEAVGDAYKRYAHHGDHEEAFPVWRTLNLALWLQHCGFA